MTSSKSQLDNNPINHHYLTQFLLRRWIKPDNKIQYYRRGYGGKLISTRISPRGTAYEPHLYTADIEVNVMSKIDDGAAFVIDKIISRGLTSLTGNDRESMAKFIASLCLRHPAEVHKNNVKGKRVLNWLMNQPIAKEEYEKIRSPYDPLTPLEAIELNYGSEKVDSIGLEASASLMNPQGLEDQEVIQHILSLKWELVNFGQADIDLLIADNPCVCVDSVPNLDCSIVALPLSPKHVLLCAKERETINKFIALKNLKIASTLNNLSVHQV